MEQPFEVDSFKVERKCDYEIVLAVVEGDLDGVLDVARDARNYRVELKEGRRELMVVQTAVLWEGSAGLLKVEAHG